MAIRHFRDQHPQLGERVFIDASAVLIGDISLGDDVSVWPNCVIRGDVESIKVGAETNIQDGSVLHVSHPSPFSEQAFPICIGKGVTIGHGAMIHGCTIGDYCLIGIGAIILDGARIEDNVMIGAGTLVAPGKRLESGFLYVGSPAKQVRPLKPKEFELLNYSSKHYVTLKDQHRIEASG